MMAARSRSCIIAVSVTSSSSRDGLMPVLTIVSRTMPTKSLVMNCTGEMLTATKQLRRAGDGHLLQALRSTHSPIGPIMPVSSAIGMNSIGGIMPRSGCLQRIRAS